MCFISASDLAALKSDPSQMAAKYTSYRTAMYNHLNAYDAFTTQSEEHLKLTFASLVCFELMPYGDYNGPSDFNSLLNATQLGCTNMCQLAWQWFRMAWPTSPAVIDALGFRNGTIGGHTFLQIETPEYEAVMTVDPTTSIMCAYNNLDRMVKGVKQSTNNVRSFLSYDIGLKQNIVSFEADVRNAFYTGSITLASFWYQFRDINVFLNLNSNNYWPTPQGVMGP